MKSRILAFYLIFILSFGLLVGRLFWLTVIEGESNRTKAEEQRVRVRRIVAPRGIIYDRENRPLVQNLPIYKICDQKKEECRIISRDQALKLEADNKDADLVVEIGREYPYGEALAHVLGYLGEATKEEMQSAKCKNQNYELGDLVGRTGIEEKYDCDLRGLDGGELIEVGAVGEIIRTVGKKEPLSGQDLKLSLDLDLQLAAYQALEKRGKKAALVASTPQGEILALVSYPSFDPNLMTRAEEQVSNKIEEILDNPQQPLFNRAISGAYPPGSTFKIVTATAGLEEGKINSQTQIEDPGEIVIGQYRYANWYFTQYGKTEGVIGLVQAIKRSTDTFFYKVGEFVGAEKLVVWAKKFGLGEISGIDIGGEIEGFLPNPSSGDWFLGNTYHLAIGQGNLGLTPLQVNNMTAVIASGGKLCKPRLAQCQMSNVKCQMCQDIGIKKETIGLITEGMKETCSTGGTAFPFFDFEPRVACKTGTAEFGDPSGRTHAWLTAFSPLDEPEIVITTIVEAGGEGSYVAAPIVKEVMEEWFKND